MKKSKRIISLGLASVTCAMTALASGCSVFNLDADRTEDGVNFETFRNQLMLPDDNDYLSRSVASYQNINGKDVEVYTFYRDDGEQFVNNPNFAQAVMIYQAIAYKKAHPEQEVTATLTSFHLSVVFAACVVPGSPDYGKVKNLYDTDYDADGYYRLSYLLVEAAKWGIKTLVVGQIDASPVADEQGVKREDYSYKAYFESHLTDEAYIAGEKVSDYMQFGYCAWTSYGDKSAADMMHNKTCTVSHRLDSDGNEHGAAVWTGSINVDGIAADGTNGNDSIQTAILLSEHDALRRVVYNYTNLLLAYCDQEDVVPFRTEVIRRTEAQVSAIEAGQAVDADEQIIYLGTPGDDVFELYFTPMGGDFSTWDRTFNPYVKYIAKMQETAKTDDYIHFIWNNVKYVHTFSLADMIIEAVATAFRESANLKNVLYLYLPREDTSQFDDLIPGKNIGQRYAYYQGRSSHIKDVQLSYVEDSERKYVSLFNSLNIHEGSMYHQTNTILVVKESVSRGNQLYIDYATMTASGVPMMDQLIKA